MSQTASQPGLLSRWRRGRGVSKLRRNRWAMVSLTVIALYMGLALWIGAMEALHWVGLKTGAYDLSQNRVLGALLPGRVTERVGPPNLAGFGLEQAARYRANQYDFMVTVANQSLAAAERLEPGSATPPRRVLDQFRMAELRLANLPVADLRALADEAAERFAEYDSISLAIAAVGKARVGSERALRLSESLRDLEGKARPEDEATRERVATMRSDLAAMLEEISFAAEDAAAVAGEGVSPLASVDAGVLFDMGMRAREEGSAGADPAVIEGVLRTAREARGPLDERASAKLDEIGAVIGRLYPRPDGLDGVLYRARLLLGTDRQGRSILVRAIYSAKVAMQVGVVASVVSVLIGTLLGAAAGFFGGWIDHAVIWVYSTLSSIPYLVLLALIAFVFQSSDWTLPWDHSVPISRTLIPLYATFCLTFWIGTCRVIRGETLKLKELEFVQAATAIGFGPLRVLLRHVIPNTAHLMFINFSLLLIAAIKSEVVLTFLGLGLKEGASWGIMISESKAEVITGLFWQIGAATFFMLVLVLAFNILSDALQDAFDPKHVG